MAKGSNKFNELQKFIRECRIFGNKLKTHHPDMNTSLYSIFRLILPNLERERGPYGMKIKTLTNLYTQVFCLGKNSNNARKLMNYKLPLSTVLKNDDFSERVFWLMRNRLQNDENLLTIQNVNKFLDDVSKSHELKKKKDEFFIHIMRKISAIELKWLTRILLKDLKLGLTQKKIFEAIHPNAEELFNVTSHLQGVCDRFSDVNSEEAEGSIEIEIFSHVKPMLLERLKIEHIGKIFTEDQHYYVQTKFDGERAQVHIKEGKYKYFSRQGYDITHNSSYGEFSNSGGFLTSNIALLLSKNIHSVIFDGELMGWHKYKKCFGSKGYTYDVKKLTEKNCYQPCFVVYDILLFNDNLLVNKEYSERLHFLNSAFTEKEGVLMMCKTNIISNIDQLLQLFNIALDNNDEGIVVKKYNNCYKPNIRERTGCYKIKAEYSDGLVHDVDLVILGGYYGNGRCSGMVRSFLIGIASPPTNKSGLPSEFFAVVKVASGLSDINLKIIQEKFKSHWRDKKPTGVFGPKQSQYPDVWISPKNSVVVQVRASEIIRTQTYPLGYSMRFPRVLKMRYDKPWHNVCLTTEFMTLIKDQGVVQKLTKKNVMSNDIDDLMDEEMPKSRKTLLSSKNIYDTFLPVENNEIIRISRLFDGKKFCVVNGDDKLNKSDITRILQNHMGKVIQNPGNDTFCILVGNPETLKAQNLILSKKYSVVKICWLLRATKLENISKIQEFFPWELFSVSSLIQQKLQTNYDQYFDSYIEDLDQNGLDYILEKNNDMLNKDCQHPLKEMKKLDQLIFNGQSSHFSIFREIIGYFHNIAIIEKYSFMFMSGTLSQELTANVSCVVVNDDISPNSLHQIRKETKNIFNDSKRLIPIVKTKWIRDCFLNRELFPIEHYTL